MRWLFLLVLSLNLAYITWQLSVPAVDSYAKVQPLNNVPAIVLLSELQSKEQLTEEKLSAQLVPAPESVPSAVGGSNLSDKQGGAAKADAEPMIVAQRVTEDVVVDAAGKAPDTQPAAVTAIGQESEESSQSGGCFTLGPFRDLEKLRGLTRDIKDYVVAADFRGLEEKEQSLFWVYLRPEISIEKAIETGERLKANKIKDFYIIREGDKIYGISLGRFRNKASAFRLAKKVSKLGFDVLTEPLFKTYTVYWLDYQLADDVSIPGAVFEKYIPSAETGEVSHLGRDCGS